MKAGTSTLHAALGCSPGITPSPRKELHYFSTRWQFGSDWYENQFPEDRATLTGEASPYYLVHPHAARRIASIVPDARIIVLLRDPVDRAYSHWSHMRKRGRESLGFLDALRAERGRIANADVDEDKNPFQLFSYFCRGRYAEQLRRLYRFFSQDRVLVLLAEELFADAPGTTARVCRWLGAPVPGDQGPIHKNRGQQRPPLAAVVRGELVRQFATVNAELPALTGTEYPWLGHPR